MLRSLDLFFKILHAVSTKYVNLNLAVYRHNFVTMADYVTEIPTMRIFNISNLSYFLHVLNGVFQEILSRRKIEALSG